MNIRNFPTIFGRRVKISLFYSAKKKKIVFFKQKNGHRQHNIVSTANGKTRQLKRHKIYILMRFVRVVMYSYNVLFFLLNCVTFSFLSFNCKISSSTISIFLDEKSPWGKEGVFWPVSFPSTPPSKCTR